MNSILKDSPWTLFLYKINKDVCKKKKKKSVSVRCPLPLHTAGFAQQTIYLYKLFTACFCKEVGEGEKGCFCTRVAGERARFERCICSSDSSAHPAGGWREHVEGEAGSPEMRRLAGLAPPGSALLPPPTSVAASYLDTSPPLSVLL